MPELKELVSFHAKLKITKHIDGHKKTNSRGYEESDYTPASETQVVNIEVKAQELDELVDKLAKYLELVEEI